MNSDTIATDISTLRRYTAGVRWIWLDLDDTLIDFKANSLIALRLTYADCRLDRYFSSCDEWVDRYMHHNHMLWERYNRAEISQDYLRMHRFLDPIREHNDIRADSFAAESRLMDTIYLDHLAEQKCMIDGATQLIDHLRTRAYNIGILSNGFTDVQHRKLHTVGLDDKVDLVVLSDDIGVNKPDTRLYIHAMKRAQLTDPARHLMIGDNPDTDIAGALQAGWHAIHYTPAAQRLSLTDYVITTPTLPALLPILNG